MRKIDRGKMKIVSAWLLALSLFFLLSAVSAPSSENGKGLIVGRVLDAETREVLPCTVAIRASDGVLLTDLPSFTAGFRSSGQFEKAVPPGDVTLTISRGFDYVAARRQLHLREHERVELTVELKRRTPLRRRGWYCGDSHVHMTHGERKIEVDSFR